MRRHAEAACACYPRTLIKNKKSYQRRGQLGHGYKLAALILVQQWRNLWLQLLVHQWKKWASCTWTSDFFLPLLAGTGASRFAKDPLGRVVVVFSNRFGASSVAPTFSSCNALPPLPAPALTVQQGTGGWFMVLLFDLLVRVILCSLKWWSLCLDFLPIFLGEAMSAKLNATRWLN